MPVLEWNRKQEYEVADYPLQGLQARLVLQVDLGGDVPPAAVRRIALRAIQRILAEADEDEFLTAAANEADLLSSTPAGESNGASRNGWIQPAGMDLRVVKSAHRLLLEVAKRAESGRAVLASELVGAAGLSAPTIGRLLRDGEPGADYLRTYVRVTPEGRTKALDLTTEGRMLASKVRAGVVPV
ncbi:MAG TPA: hypothetical protein VI796_00830 [Candidatus Thermoplasmatota archaeon]|nr:hypothetical protein [Candidatus Thermoplasmatota archaeon]